ncbi:hypothetical protein CUREO_0331 [Campylobacter ureolyticus RIGS 9880]|uniref:Uncharacterized protein n=1 Tax=Campylobacter ureolyticus RIGS 9880 TaxID=1032069 RepID=A0AAU8U137_9BACT|nr:hypothetical protein [Campylobacter ureolyticus]AKT90211.1 hypothetical protein CUREO_0331 [Campylobacter ureolyticus RIGS 9880]
MKSAKNIIEEIQTSPLFNDINDKRKFLSLLSKTHQKLIAFIYLKDQILYFACKHNVGLQELKKDSNINLIKELLKTYIKFHPDSNLNGIKDIRFFVASKFMKKKEKIKEIFKINLPPKFADPSNGEFKNNIRDKKNHALFEEIRKLILANK